MCINSSLFLFSYTRVFVCLLIHVINDYIFCISVISQEMVNYLLMVNYIYYWHLQNGSRCKMLLIEMLVSPYSPLYLICSQFVSGSLCLTYPHIDTHKLHLIKAIEILISTFFHFFFFFTQPQLLVRSDSTVDCLGILFWFVHLICLNCNLQENDTPQTISSWVSESVKGILSLGFYVQWWSGCFQAKFAL